MEKVSVPEGTKGDWSIDHFTITQDGAMWFNIRAGARRVIPGNYTRLNHRSRGVIMSDTPAEQSDHRAAVRNANGSCLINGLGMGMVLHNILLKPEVTDVIVVELEQDVIDLVAATYLKDPRVTIVHASAFDYVPPKGKKFGMVWHDIWDSITADNLPEMTKLHRKYGRRADWQDSWCKWECQRDR